MISGILLAAGESTRMEGAFKPLLKWGRRTVIGECIENLRGTTLAEIIVVLGHREADVRERLAGSGVGYAINPDYKSGMLSSIKTGWAQVSPQSDAVLIALVDQPMIDSATIRKLIEAFNHGGKKIALPVYAGKRGHPVILSRDLERQVMQLREDIPDGLKALINAYNDDVLEVPVDSSAVLEDIDRPEDYERLSKQFQPVYAYRKWSP
ncbi:MAG: nucleotidyltransferase family protein [Acidobacteria bacterium]|nr:nucleotidyltransferase family protein [Acidobacteriota bacterium]MCW5971215.1 nucleotidyltransferase family protein [Blastocatellales bacterium]